MTQTKSTGSPALAEPKSQREAPFAYPRVRALTGQAGVPERSVRLDQDCVLGRWEFRVIAIATKSLSLRVSQTTFIAFQNLVERLDILL